ncbi:hypothetical protein [Streptomyces griseocarneus]|uniref:hypothetical protein n=1 Tax=Streptomyces griseocarneus TaxID=51201 RepID=UPI00167CADB9|nr:hypothetical protein [Streptomyces griseocarneus]MBZ6473926.1 hypothetical protein [Streptomyces griseocarneus]GHG65944.1 hypothetical protein GCM10018779_37000 [Streptomyces griseocarneus]
MRICENAKAGGYLTPFYEWHNACQLLPVPQLPREFIHPNDPDPFLNGEVVLREEEMPLPDVETWRIGPPVMVCTCIPGPRGCPHA